MSIARANEGIELISSARNPTIETTSPIESPPTMKDFIDALLPDTKEYLAPSMATFVKMVRYHRDKQPKGKLHMCIRN